MLWKTHFILWITWKCLWDKVSPWHIHIIFIDFIQTKSIAWNVQETLSPSLCWPAKISTSSQASQTSLYVWWVKSIVCLVLGHYLSGKGALFEEKLPYEPFCPSLGWSVGLSFIISIQHLYKLQYLFFCLVRGSKGLELTRLLSQGLHFKWKSSEDSFALL